MAGTNPQIGELARKIRDPTGQRLPEGFLFEHPDDRPYEYHVCGGAYAV
jgi:hypothetical protein